jgi:type II secretory pathway component GspD/PulD (secretin)
MNNPRPLKLLVCLLILCIGPWSSAQTRQEDVTLETVGKENPFEIVTPKADFLERMRPVQEPQQVQQTIIEEIPDLFVQTIMLKFLQAASVEPVAAGLASRHGVVAVDAATNSLIIADTAENLKRMVDQIRKADQTPKQVMIEVVIVDVQLNDETEIGVNWQRITGGNTEKYTQTLATTLATAGTSGMDFSFLRDGIDVTIHALQQVKDVEILASPKIMVVSGQSAMIQTVEEIPYTEQSETSAGGSLTSTQFREVGVTLNVTATITDDDRIKLMVQPEQSVNTGRFGTQNQSGVPIIDTRKAMTTLMMKDGQAVVMGGLRSRTKRNTVDKIPLLGDLPLVGFLFSNDKVELEQTELVVFLAPHIYKGDPLSEEQMEHFNELNSTPPLEFKEHTRPEYEFMKGVFAPIIGADKK